MGCVIHWFRRDLRIRDNEALRAALSTGEPVIPVYILSTWKKSHPWTGYPRQAFLCGSLKNLDKNLRDLGGRLILRAGDQEEQLRKLIRETGATAIYTNRDPDPFGKSMEKRVAKMADEENIDFQTHKDLVLHEHNEVLKDDGDPYRVFTPYSRTWWKLDKPSSHGRPRGISVPDGIDSLELPTPENHWDIECPEGFEGPIEPGEDAARDRLKLFLNDIAPRYKQDRNTPYGQTTSRLSQDLRWGTLSIREIFDRAIRKRDEAGSSAAKSLNSFINELAWREFYMAILHHFPDVLERDFNPSYADVKWDPVKGDRLERWQRGQTGFPIVDAGMRELNRTGFMHNRLRMITAMFLTKDLHIHWMEGEKYFMQRLTDGEIASNNGGWQWSAGTGADAAPYFRIQNPWTQGERYDKQGCYIKENVPELADVDPAKFHKPPEDDEPIAPDYPTPMVNHQQERDETLRRFKIAKNSYDSSKE